MYNHFWHPDRNEKKGRFAMNYRLTIIMSNYNQGELLKIALESVFMQKVNFDYKIIITDDCSRKDNSLKIINKYTEKYPNIEAIYSDENSGYLANIIRAKKETKTDYFCLLDADDFWVDEFYLQKAYDFLEKNKDYSIYESNVYVLPENCEVVSYKDLHTFVSSKIKSGTYTKEMFVKNITIPITQTTGMFFRNTIFCNGIPNVMMEAVGTQAERSFEGDTDRFIMHLNTGKAFYSTDSVGVYRMTKGGIWSRLSLSEKYLLNARSYMDYYSFYESDLSFFAEKAWFYLKKCMEEKSKEAQNLSVSNSIITTSSAEMIDAVYEFCHRNRELIQGRKNKVSVKQKVRRIIGVLKE